MPEWRRPDHQYALSPVASETTITTATATSAMRSCRAWRAPLSPCHLTQFRASNGKNRTGDTCGTLGTRPCAIFDLDEASLLLGTPDLNQFRLLNGKAPGPRCTTCPLTCTAGTTGTCF
jgi:hypothetical protein